MRDAGQASNEAFLADDATYDRLSFYRFLGTLFSQPLSEENIKELFKQDYITTFRAAFADALDAPAFHDWIFFIQDHLRHDPASLHQILAREFTRLFRGLYPKFGPRPPYEAVYRAERQEVSIPILRQVHVFYQKIGIAPQVNERADFIGLEVDLMRCLIEEELRARQSGNRAEALKYLAWEREWLKEHLLRWVPLFCEELKAHAELGFYKSLGGIAVYYFEEDLRYLEHEFNQHS